MHISFINCRLVGAGDCHQTPDNQEFSALVCRPRLLQPVTLPFGVVPVLLITAWAACPNPLPPEQGQT